MSSSESSSSSSLLPKGSCVVTESESSEIHLILVSPVCAPRARVVRVCPTSGALLNVRVPSSSSSSSRGKDDAKRGGEEEEEGHRLFFESDADALNHLKELGKVKTATRCACVLGVSRLGDHVGALVATKVQKAMRLPTGDDVFRICETRWIKTTSISSPVRQLTEQEKEHARALMDFPIDGLHFYSETFDLTKSLAFRDSQSSGASTRPEESEWVWNQAIAKPLRDALGDDASFRGYVPVMIQGLAESREILVDANDPKKGSWHFAVFGKRSRLHPGTRFLARGINEDGNPGNEVEMEQMVWRSNSNSNSNSDGISGSKKTIWTSYVWRRGSVPLRWKQEIKQTVGDAQIEIETKDTYKNAERYFARLRESYGECNPIACVNLLRIAPGKPEAELSRHFHECVELCRNILPNDPNLTVTNFDWHTNVKGMGDASAVESMWKLLRDKIRQHGYGYGTFDEATGELKTLRKQAGVLRYNCADSLDRTNLAGFFVAVQLLAEQTKRLGLANVLTDPESTSLQSTKLMEKAKEDQFLRSADEDLSARLPEGWESRLDTTTGRTFYIDHNTRSTSWALPDDFVKVINEEKKERQTRREAILQKRKDDAVIREKEKEEAERKLFEMGESTNTSEHSIFPPSEQDSYVWLDRTVDTLRMNMSRAALSAASEVYLQNGDLHALIYTSTRASHTAMMHLLDSTASHDSNSRFKSSQSTASNLSISVQRRFVNLVSDGFRQTQFELFLGLRRKHYFPSLAEDPLEERRRVVKSRATLGGALIAAPRCAIDIVQNSEMVAKESFFLGEESGLSDTSNTSFYGTPESNGGGGDKVSIDTFFKSAWPCPRSSRSESLSYEVRDFGGQESSSGGVENWLLLTDPKGANERFAPGRVRVNFLSASKKKSFSIVLKLPIIPTHATMALPLLECAGPFDTEEGAWKYSQKRLDGNIEDAEFCEKDGAIEREHQNMSAENVTSKIKLTFEPRAVGTLPSAEALTMALGRVEILGGDDNVSTSDEDFVGALSPEDESYLEQNSSLDAYERVAVEIVEHASAQGFEDRLNANLMLEILRLRLRLTSKFRDAKFGNLRNVDSQKLDPTTMLRTRRARRILENLRIQKENPVKNTSVVNTASVAQNVGTGSSSMDTASSATTYFPEAQTMSRSKTPILGGALTSSSSLTSVASAAASKFAGFANSIANTAGSKLSGSLKDSTANIEGLSISNRNETTRGDSNHGKSGVSSGSHSSPEKMASHVVSISPVMVEKKRLDDENERRVLTKLSVLRDLAKSLDEFTESPSQEFNLSSPNAQSASNAESNDTAEAIVEELKSRSRVKRERVKDVVEEIPDDAHFLTLRGRHIYCAVAFTAAKGMSRKSFSAPGSPSSSTIASTPPITSPTIEVDGFKFMPPPIPVLSSSSSSSSSSLFWCLRVSSFRDETLENAEHIGDFRIPLLKNAPRTQLAFDFDGGRKSAFAFVFELACANASSESHATTTYHSLHSRVQMFRYVPNE